MSTTESTLNFIPEFLRDIAGRVLPQLMSEHFWIQFAAVALAVFIAAGVSAFVGKKHAYWRSKNPGAVALCEYPAENGHACRGR